MASPEFFSYLSSAEDVSFMLDEQGRRALIDKLLPLETDVDAAREKIMWEKGNIYFHAIQDLRLASSNMRLSYPERESEINQIQSCYYKDLVKYIEGLDQDQPEIWGLIEDFIILGTSFDWNESHTAINALDEQFTAIDRDIIRPWANSK